MTSATKVDWNLFYTLLQNFSPDVKRVADLGSQNDFKNKYSFEQNKNSIHLF